ncbi:hypothetical protein Cgig2_031498 [Carnegiea gigantea]|uniref:DUF7890 domain-containing protein n=1 Tax=Carnegiea gigantea TaxID=171969 RepID=A0A9Q1QC00_9CARY|nr:hypothetical protein Cgig2_031498 [Carnegiea gigantea]
MITNKPKIQNYICRDELSRKKRVCKPRKLQRSPRIIGYYREEDEATQVFKELKMPILPSIIPEDVEKSYSDSSNNNKVNNVRVKVLLTKKEAAELLANCTAEANSNLDAIYVVNELVKLPAQRVNVVSISSLCQDTMLSTIPEEDEDDEDEDEDEEFFMGTGPFPQKLNNKGGRGDPIVFQYPNLQSKISTSGTKLPFS